MRRRRRKSLEAPEPVDAILARAGEDRFAPRRPPVSAALWRSAVGARIAERTVPLTLERGTLLVRAATSTWSTELSLLGDVILERLRAHGVLVEKLRFRTGPVESPWKPPERRETRRVPAPDPLPPSLATAIAHVPDEELRAVLADAAGRSLAWQRYAGVGFSESLRAARAPRDAGKGSALPDSATGGASEGPPRSRGGGRDR